MTEWTHSLCESCWRRLWGDERDPVRVRAAPFEVCCTCGGMHRSGIYVRGNPDDYLCKGVHKK